jgi:flagellar basal-body rod protein FlgB
MTDLFTLGARRLDWVAHRQSLVARNVANADTPGYKPRDVSAFDDRLDAAGLRLSVTSPTHMTATGSAAGTLDDREARGWETSISGNAVSLEQELSRAAETNRQAGVATAAMKAFQRLALLTVKG